MSTLRDDDILTRGRNDPLEETRAQMDVDADDADDADTSDSDSDDATDDADPDDPDVGPADSGG